MVTKQQQIDNLTRSIVLIGPFGVGKSLLADTLATKAHLPVVDIDELITMLELDVRQALTPDPAQQKAFIARTLESGKLIPKNPAEFAKQAALVQEFVARYNDYQRRFGDFQKFHDALNQYQDAFYQGYLDDRARLYQRNKITYQILEQIFTTAETPFIISAPGPFGWHETPAGESLEKTLQDKISNLLGLTRNVLLVPGQDYARRNPEPGGINALILAHPEYYNAQADLIVSTNGLFNQPDTRCLKRRLRFDAAERIAKEKLQNRSEINNICDQILTHLGNDFTKDNAKADESLLK